MKIAKIVGAAAMIGLCGLWQGSAFAQLIRDPDAEAAYQEGTKLAEEKKYGEAIAAFNKALSLDSTYVDALVGKGDALRAMEDYKSAAAVYTEVLNYDANSAAAYNGRGESLMNSSPPQIDLALNDFYNALNLDNNNAVVLSNIGHILVNNQVAGQTDPTAALRVLDSALAINDKDGRAYRDRGLAHARIANYEKSIEDLKKAVEVDPGDYENFSTLATVYMFREDYEPAIEAVSKAIEAYKPKLMTDPVIFVDGYLMRADAHQRLGYQETDPDKRKAAFEGAVADADAVLKEFKDRPPQNGIAYYRRGRALRMLDQYAQAIDSLTDAIQAVAQTQDPGYVADAYFYRGICWHYMGSESLARGDFTQASATGSGFSDPRVYLWIGYTYHLEEDFREALRWYSQAIAKDPNYTLAHVNRGRAYMDLKEYRKAIDSFNNAVRTEPNVGEHYYDVAYAYTKLEDYQKAVGFFDLALLKDNPQPKMFRGMADALRKLGRDELAREYDEKADAAESKTQASN